MRDPVALVVPQMNPNDETAVLVRWHVRSGSRVALGQPLATLETTKATFDVDAPENGYAFFDHPPKAVVAVGAPIAWICENETRPPAASAVSAAPAPSATADTGSAAPAEATDARFTRKALRLMKQHGLAPSDFDSAGRIDVAEVERLVRERAAGGAARVPASAPARVPASAPADAEPLEQSSSKIIEVQALGEVYRHAIPSTVAVSLSVARVNARLGRLAAELGTVSLLEVAIHDAARLLPEFPELNGFYADGCAWRHASVAIGFAINLGRSLRVPVVARAAELSQLEVAQSVRDLSLRYMRGELQMADVVGGTFTVTDLSSFGVVSFIPVLNQRQSAILGICAERPGTDQRDLVLTFDHRMADGMRAAVFLGELRARLESAPGG